MVVVDKWSLTQVLQYLHWLAQANAFNFKTATAAFSKYTLKTSVATYLINYDALNWILYIGVWSEFSQKKHFQRHVKFYRLGELNAYKQVF